MFSSGPFRSFFLLFALATTSLSGCKEQRKSDRTVPAQAVSSRPFSPSILSATEAALLPDALWIDVRTLAEHRQGYIPETRLIPLQELPARLGELKQEQERNIVLVCASGARATEAAQLLSKEGFSHLYILEGGMFAWSNPINAFRLDPDGPHFQDRFRVGLNLSVIWKTDQEYPHQGLEISTVYPGGSAAGRFALGEVITAINGHLLDKEALMTASYQTLFPPGKITHLRILGNDGRIREDTLPPLPEDPISTPPILQSSPIVDIWQQSPQKALLTKEGQVFRTTFRLQTRAWLPTASALAAKGLMDPIALGDLLTTPLPTVSTTALPHEILQKILAELPGIHSSYPSSRWTLPLPLSQALRAVANLTPKSHRIAEASEADIPLEERYHFRESVGKFRKELERRVFIHDIPSKEDIASTLALVAYGLKFHQEPCLKAVHWMSQILQPPSLKVLSQISHGPEQEPPSGLGVTGTIRGWLDTPDGLIVFGGRSRNEYQGKFLAIIDPAGDDRYHLIAGKEPSLLLDLAGNDHYEIKDLGEKWAPGRALLLADLEGDDVYTSSGAGLASGYFSTSILLDASGNDTYQSKHSGLGAGRFGIGLLLDLQGNDHYLGGRGTQGFGGPGGLGLLLDRAGDDLYETQPSNEVDHSSADFAQGCGMGIRELSYGGLGILIDQAGKDRYSARDYAQGVGYFGGFGILKDHTGNDLYTGHKYTQGAGVHGAMGLLWDETGDDIYQLEESERGQGMAWDLALAALIDNGGEDRYEALGMAQGFSAQNGLALLIDRNGGLQRHCSNLCGGITGTNNYAGGRGTTSFAWLFLP